jgi:excisionase family DNA binding protein
MSTPRTATIPDAQEPAEVPGISGDLLTLADARVEDVGRSASSVPNGNKKRLVGRNPVNQIFVGQVQADRHGGESIMQELVDAVATGDRDAVFAVASRFVEGVPAVVEQKITVEDKWLTVDEVAAHANVCRMTVWRWRNERGLKFSKVGTVVRIRRSELDGLLNKHMQG